MKHCLLMVEINAISPSLREESSETGKVDLVNEGSVLFTDMEAVAVGMNGELPEFVGEGKNVKFRFGNS